MADFLEIIKGRIQSHPVYGPQDAYSRELHRFASEKNAFNRDPVAEAQILTRWDMAFLYSKNVLESRWEEFETVMAQAPATSDLNSIRAAYSYVDQMVGHELKLVEKHIANDPVTAADYTVNIPERPQVDADTNIPAASGRRMAS